MKKKTQKTLSKNMVSIMRCIGKGLLIIGFFLGISLITQRYNVTERSERIQEKIKIFSSIDKFAHEEINEDPKENHFNEEEKKNFYALDREYHNAKDINETYRTCKKIVDFLIQGETSRPNLGAADTDKERDAEFTRMLGEFIAME